MAPAICCRSCKASATCSARGSSASGNCSVRSAGSQRNRMPVHSSGCSTRSGLRSWPAATVAMLAPNGPKRCCKASGVTRRTCPSVPIPLSASASNAGTNSGIPARSGMSPSSASGNGARKSATCAGRTARQGSSPTDAIVAASQATVCVGPMPTCTPRDRSGTSARRRVARRSASAGQLASASAVAAYGASTSRSRSLPPRSSASAPAFGCRSIRGVSVAHSRKAPSSAAASPTPRMHANSADVDVPAGDAVGPVPKEDVGGIARTTSPFPRLVSSRHANVRVS